MFTSPTLPTIPSRSSRSRPAGRVCDRTGSEVLQMSDLLSAALGYIDAGFLVIPIPHGEKGPPYQNWQALRITHKTAPQFFNGERGNIGVIMGHGDVADVDLDCSEV